MFSSVLDGIYFAKSVAVAANVIRMNPATYEVLGFNTPKNLIKTYPNQGGNMADDRKDNKSGGQQAGGRQGSQGGSQGGGQKGNQQSGGGRQGGGQKGEGKDR